jgi:hypothetical protein
MADYIEEYDNKCYICKEKIDYEWSCTQCGVKACKICINLWYTRSPKCPFCKLHKDGEEKKWTYKAPKPRTDGVSTYDCRTCGGVVSDKFPVACDSCHNVNCRRCFKYWMHLTSSSNCPTCEEPAGFTIEQI